jgi:hypothetical protein
VHFIVIKVCVSSHLKPSSLLVSSLNNKGGSGWEVLACSFCFVLFDVKLEFRVTKLKAMLS